MSNGDSTQKKCLKCGAWLTNLSAHNCGCCGANQHEIAKEREAVKQLTETMQQKATEEQTNKISPEQPSIRRADAPATHLKSSEKQGQTALLLCVTLGMVGAHRFYVGKFGSALLIALAPLPTLIAIVTILLHFGQEQLVSGITFSLAMVLLVYATVGTVVLRDLINISSAKFKDKHGNRLTF